MTLCQKCESEEASVCLDGEEHLCEACADAYFASTGMNPMCTLICLSDFYRSRLYDLLEVAHPEAFDNHDNEAAWRGSRLIEDFLREQFKKDNINIEGDAFAMLCIDFWGSPDFYARGDRLRRKRDKQDLGEEGPAA